LGERIVANARLALPAGARELRFVGHAADALRVYVDDQSLGWTWGPEWRLSLPRELPAGAHRLRVELVPSTFNTFGPHRYLYGDWHVVSPDQLTGVKNFGDPHDAPAHTHGPDWHFKALRLPTAVSIG
jgi:hypothetical protein